ncbi:MAG: 4-hydroxy-3-methylbut-2-enyl diphosphate reductase [Planctomycetota bacterium]|jgi:4-hydroxy-3-methylbut-2-enyl diphosphate reductase
MAEQRYFRKGFGFRAEVHKDVVREFDSRILQGMMEDDYRLEAGGLTFRLAEEFGFCYGVDRAVDYAYETRRVYPDRRIFLMGQIIHNPAVNRRLEEMGIPLLDDPVGEVSDLGPDDVVIIPAFGVSTADLDRLQAAGPILVDTTCGSVLAVWKNVERYAKQGFTALIHGKYLHEETRATASRALLHPGGRYIVVLNLDEAEIVCEYVRGEGDRDAFLARLDGAMSPGFDPDRDLVRIGMANQTTMLASESLEIQRLVREAMADRYGEEALAEHLVAFDTICPATQQRQDALLNLLEERMDLALIVGGYNSSNTSHLVKIAARTIPTFHIENADEILSAEEIRHRATDGNMVVTSDWLPSGPLTIGLTAGASTPNLEIGRVVRKVLSCRGVELPTASTVPET